MSKITFPHQLLTQNLLLTCLPDEERRNLLTHASPLKLEYQQTVYDAGDAVRQVYFPVTCVISTVAIMNDGTTVETGMVGREGAVGVTSVFGDYHARNWTRVLIPGVALAVCADALRGLFDEGGALRRLMLDYYRTRIGHASRRAVCNARHLLHERVCTWLLMLHDRTGADDIPLTQEAVARQMGARRAGVNEIMGLLQRYGVVGHSRGHVIISDRERLEHMACVCYGGYKREVEWCKGLPDGVNRGGGHLRVLNVDAGNESTTDGTQVVYSPAKLPESAEAFFYVPYRDFRDRD